MSEKETAMRSDFGSVLIPVSANLCSVDLYRMKSTKKDAGSSNRK